MQIKRYIPYFIFILLLIPITFLDLNVSLTLYHPESVFGEMLERLGFLPMVFFASLSFILLAEDKKKMAPFFYFLSFGIFFAFLFAYYHYANSDIPFYAYLFPFFAFFPTLKLGQYFYKLKGETMVTAAKIWLSYIVLTLIVVTALKYFWGRQRFFTMVNPWEEFTLWFIPHPFATSNAFKSFPSGHAAEASMMIAITLLYDLGISKHKKILYGITIVWTVLVALSRIVVGVHFLSDVYFGMSISFFLYHLTKRYFLKNN